MNASRLDDIDATVARLVAAFQLASTIDVGRYLHAGHADELEREVAQPLRDAITGAIDQLGELEAHLEGQEIEGEWDDVLEPTQVGDTPRIGRMLTDELWQHVTDMCFAARGELRRAERSIRQVQPGHDDRLTACEAAHRKLRRALAAVLSALGRARDRTFPVLAELSADIESAAAVRRMYTKFRRSLPACDPGEPASVRRALRFAAVSLAVMVGGGDFGDARTPDRALILQLQRRILRWARDGASDADGVRLYRDIVTAADLLRAINLRQELAAHDQQRLREAAAALAGDDPAAAIAAALPALHALDGRDDALDDLVAVALREPPTPTLVSALRAAVSPPAAPLPDPPPDASPDPAGAPAGPFSDATAAWLAPDAAPAWSGPEGAPE